MKTLKKRNIMKIKLVLLYLTCLLITSCKKQTLICEGNCYSLNIKGNVINGITNKNESNVPLIVEQLKPNTSIITSFKTVKDFVSGPNGSFNVFADIDSTMFEKRYYLRIMMKKNDNFLTLPIRGEENYLYDIKSKSFDSLNIVVYPKANLKINLNRTQNDNFQSFSVSYYFKNSPEFNAYYISSPNEIIKKEVIVPTSTDIFTKIIITKRDLNGVNTQKIDSIKCVKNKENIYNIDY
jgi:hypothetical protein